MSQLPDGVWHQYKPPYVTSEINSKEELLSSPSHPESRPAVDDTSIVPIDDITLQVTGLGTSPKSQYSGPGQSRNLDSPVSGHERLSANTDSAKKWQRWPKPPSWRPRDCLPKNWSSLELRPATDSSHTCPPPSAGLATPDRSVASADPTITNAGALYATTSIAPLSAKSARPFSPVPSAKVPSAKDPVTTVSASSSDAMTAADNSASADSHPLKHTPRQSGIDNGTSTQSPGAATENGNVEQDGHAFRSRIRRGRRPTRPAAQECNIDTMGRIRIIGGEGADITLGDEVIGTCGPDGTRHEKARASASSSANPGGSTSGAPGHPTDLSNAANAVQDSFNGFPGTTPSGLQAPSGSKQSTRSSVHSPMSCGVSDLTLSDISVSGDRQKIGFFADELFTGSPNHGITCRTSPGRTAVVVTQDPAFRNPRP